MGDLANDPAVCERGDGEYEATLSSDWEIWGPMGGYVAACALRGRGRVDTELRPAAFSCHYLSVARFGTVDIRVSTRSVAALSPRNGSRSRRRADRSSTAMAWSVGEVEGLEHDETNPPPVPGPEQVPSVRELLPDDAQPPFPFWNNFDEKPLEFESEWPPDGPRRGVAGVAALLAHCDLRRSVDRRHAAA